MPNTPRHSRRQTPSDDLTTLEAELTRLQRRERRTREKIEKVERRIRKLQGRADTSAPSRADKTSPETPAAPNGVHAIRLLVSEDATRVWRAAELHGELQARGWVSPRAKHPLEAVEAVVSRLVRRGELERLAPGRYRASQAPAPSVSPLSVDPPSGGLVRGVVNRR